METINDQGNDKPYKL